MTRKSPCTPVEINNFIRTDSERGMDQMIYILNNSLEGLPFNPSEPGKKMQQGNDLLTQCFINDFHWKLQQNKGRQNKTSGLALKSKTSQAILFSLNRRHFQKFYTLKDTENIWYTNFYSVQIVKPCWNHYSLSSLPHRC